MAHFPCILITMNPPVFDQPLPWIHFRMQLTGFPPIIAMRQPGLDTAWVELYDLGVRSVLRLAVTLPRYDPSPLALLGEILLEDQFEGGDEAAEVAEEELVNKAVRLLEAGLGNGGVVIHCVGGRGRTGTVIGGFLHAHGLPAHVVVPMLDSAYIAAGRPGWPESDWQGEVIGRIHL